MDLSCDTSFGGQRLLLPRQITLAVVVPVAVVQIAALWVAITRGGDQSRLGASLLAWAVTSTVVAGLAGFLIGWILTRRLRRLNSTLREAQYCQRGAVNVVARAGDEIEGLSRSVAALVRSAGEHERRVLEESFRDPLTGLGNRRYATERARIAIERCRKGNVQVAALVLDLDRFKIVNDTLGHDAGDALLRAVAGRLKLAVRDDDVCARLGSDEFVILLEEGSRAAETVASQVHAALRKPVVFQGQRIDIDASIGIAIFPDGGRDGHSLLRNAGLAMSEAKRRRTGTHFHDENAVELHRGHLSLLGELRTALESGEFELEYQPKLCLRTGTIAGVEGLVRWNHPTRGRVAPDEFIPFAEQTGFIRELTDWVIREGAISAAAFFAIGLNLKVSVNIAAQDLQLSNFCPRLREALESAGAQPDWLCLEVTEGGVLTDGTQAMRNLNELSKMGVRLSVDDFGTGYATLRQLQRLPVQELKIDRSFVTNMQLDKGNQSIVRSLISLACQLGIRAVGEGVETQADLHMLAQLGCHEAQGYYLAKPMPFGEMATWAEERTSDMRVISARPYSAPLGESQSVETVR